jgi:hypothetical protein
MTEKKAELIKNIMINLGILLILVSAMASKDGSIALVLGLVLLAIQTLDFKAVEPKRLVLAEIIIACAISLSTIVQLSMSKGFGSPQVFMIILLLGGLLIMVEAVRKYADL